MAADWSKAPLDVLHLVAKKITTLTAMARFGAVCKSWRSLVLQHNWFGLPVGAISESSLPRLMLDEASNSDVRRFFDLASGQVFEIHLPEAQGRRCCGSSHGWVVTVGEDLEVHLLNPLSREQVRLPPLSTSGDFIEKAILTCSPNGGARIYLVVALIRSEDQRSLAYIRPGEDDWTLVEEEDDGHLPQDDIIYYKEHLYGVNRDCELVTWDFEPDHKWETIGTVVSPDLKFYCGKYIEWRYYLAIVHGEIVAIARALLHLQHPDGYCHYYTHSVELLNYLRKFKYEPRRATMIQSLGDGCLFLGRSSSMSISPVPQGCRPNCIYFTDNHYFCETTVGYDMGVFSLDDGKFEPFPCGVSDSYFSHPIWVTMNSSK